MCVCVVVVPDPHNMLLRIVSTPKTNQIRVGGPVPTVCFVFLIQSSVWFFWYSVFEFEIFKRYFKFYDDPKSELLFFMSPGFMITFY